jgi:hypothetical protein
MKNPVYKDGKLHCGECGQPMACSDTRFGDSMASCGDTGCSQGQREFESGSIRHNPSIPIVRKLFNYDHPSRFYLGAADYIVKDGVKVGGN